MTLSIRARLTLWYSSIVVLVLVTAAVVGSLAQSRLAVQRLDEHVLRTMATLEGVMRTEFGEGLGLEAAAGEASAEVVAPDRTMALTRSDGTVLQVWGLPIDRDAVSSIGSIAGPSTVRSIAGDLRVLRHQVEYARNTYVAVVMARLAQYRAQQAEMVRALALGALIALIAAAATGWIIGRQTLKPLTRMADQARGMDAREPRDRLAAPPVDDELGRLAAAFNGLLDRLAAALNHQRQFMADASHEPRTPVSVVRTATQVTLLRDDRTADEYRESLEIIGEQATRLTRVVDAMFLLSRAEADGVPLRREFLNLDDVLVESARAVRVLAKQRGVKIATNGDEEVGLTGDATLLRRMVGNLLDNAVRHAEPDGSVSAGLERSPDRVALRITNDGPGIPAADQARIFERFVRMGTSDGAGLGRPIARWIAEAHGGTLALDGSAPGRTTFVVTLPLDHVINRSSAREQDQNLSQEGQEIRSFLFPGKNS
jgi:signal transduction histidine kinase